jgi:hypothetical protein
MPKHRLPATSENACVAKRIKAASAEREGAKERPSQNPFATFIEWTGEADERAYADL